MSLNDQTLPVTELNSCKLTYKMPPKGLTCCFQKNNIRADNGHKINLNDTSIRLRGRNKKLDEERTYKNLKTLSRKRAA